MQRRTTHMFAAVALFVAPGLGLADQDAPPAPPDPIHADMLDAEAYFHTAEQFIVRSSFRITRGPHRWVTLYNQIQFADGSFLTTPDGKSIVKAWGDLFTPNDDAQYDDCRLGFNHTEIEAAANLPKAQRTVLFISPHIWDKKQGKYIGNGWDVRCPVIVTTDPDGKITRTEFFYTPPLNPDTNGYEQTDAKVCELALTHLKPKPGLKVYETRTLRDMAVHRLILGDRQARLGSDDRGYFFESIDSPEKARELVELGLPKSLIINDAQQFDAIVAEMKQIHGWDPEQWMADAAPQWYGLTVEPVPGLGYRVRVLLFWHFDYGAFGYRNLYQREYRIAHDGRMGVDEKLILQGPAPPYGVPPGWQPEFGWKPVDLPPDADPAERLGAIPSNTAAYDAQNDAVQKALKPGHHTQIAPRLKVTDAAAKIPLPPDELNF